VSSTNIRKIKTSLENLALEKGKMEKGDKPKKKAGQKVKARLRIEGDVSSLKLSDKKFFANEIPSRTITRQELEHSRPTTMMTSCKLALSCEH
jgi:hypothetical protein